MASSALSLQGPIGVQDNRNRIINGDFNIWQRGITVDIASTGGNEAGGDAATGCANSFVADRWRVYAQANTTNVSGMTSPTMIVSRRNFDLGLPSGADASSKYYLNIFVGNTTDPSGGEGAGKWHYAGFTAHGNPSTGRGATDGGCFVALVQDIEDVRTFENKSCTVSFWAKSDITNQRVAPVLKQMFAGGTAGGSGVLIAGSTGHLGHTLDNTWRRYETSFNVPSIEGQPSLGSSGDDALQLQFVLHANSGKAGTGVTFEIGGDLNAGKTGNISFAQVQLEQGSKVTAFEQRNTRQEIEDCQYYYQKSYPLVTPAGGITYDGVRSNLSHTGIGQTFIVPFPTTMRKAPIARFYNPQTGNQGSMMAGNMTTHVTPTMQTAWAAGGHPTSESSYHIHIENINRGSAAAGTTYYYHYTADAELSVTTI